MKFDVTPELASLIKVMRVRNGVSSKDAAEQIGKSPSYLSKLEGGAVRTIDERQLRNVFVAISGNADFYETALPQAASLLMSTMKRERLLTQVWFIQFDVITRPVKIPADMAKDIAATFAGLGKSVGDVTEFINANVDSETTAALPANQVLVTEYDGLPRFIVRLDLREATVRQVLEGESSTTSFFVLYTVVHTMQRMKLFPQATTKLPPDEAISVLSATAEYMDRWDVRTLVDYSRYLASDEFLSTQLANSQKQSGVVSHLADLLSEIVEHDQVNATRQLSAFHDTLEWDPAFALKIAGIPFAKLGELSYANKRKMLEEIEAVVARYNEMDDFERRIEIY